MQYLGNDGLIGISPIGLSMPSSSLSLVQAASGDVSGAVTATAGSASNNIPSWMMGVSGLLDIIPAVLGSTRYKDLYSQQQAPPQAASMPVKSDNTLLYAGLAAGALLILTAAVV